MTTTTSPRVEHIAPGKIKPHPSNVRTDLGDLTELTDSIKAKGVLQPLVVAPEGLLGKGYVLIAGHRRHAAALAAGVKEVTVVVRDDLDTEAAQLEAMLIENVHRADLTPVEEGDAYQQLLAFDGYDVKTISAKTGRAARTIRDRVAIAKLPDNARAAVSMGQVTLEQASKLAQLAKDDPEAVKRLEAAFGSDHFPFDLERAVQAAERAKQLAKVKAQLTKAGVPIADLPSNWHYMMNAPARQLAGQVSDRHYYYPPVQLTAEEHADCPHHAAVINFDATVTYVCTNPQAHAPERDEEQTGSSSPARPTATNAAADLVQPGVAVNERDREDLERTAREREEREKAIEEDRQNREAAAALRKAHIETLMRQALPGQHLPVLVECAITMGMEREALNDAVNALAWLGVDVPEHLDWDTSAEMLLKEMTVKGPGRTLLAALAADIEPGLIRSYRYTTAEIDTAEATWLRALASMGYELSPYERSLLEDHDARVAAAAAEAEDDEGGDDE